MDISNSLRWMICCCEGDDGEYLLEYILGIFKDLPLARAALQEEMNATLTTRHDYFTNLERLNVLIKNLSINDGTSIMWKDRTYIFKRVIHYPLRTL